MYDYLEEFQAAVERTSRLGLTAPEVDLTLKTYLTPEAVGEVAALLEQMSRRGLTAEQIDHGNFQLHLDLLEELEELLGCQAYYTIGGVSTPKATLCNPTERDAALWAEHFVPGTPIEAHTWITLDSAEIIDLTFLTTVGVMSGNAGLVKRVIAGFPQRIAGARNTDPNGTSQLPNGVKHHPLVVGADLFRQMGILVDTRGIPPHLYDAMLALDNSPLFVVGFSRAEIRRGLWAPQRELLERLASDRELAARWRGRLDFSVSGYDADPRSLFEIAETRDFILELDRLWPYAFFFLNKEHGHFLRTLLYVACSDRVETGEHIPAGQVAFMINVDKWQAFNRRHLEAMEELRRRLDLPREYITEAFDQIADYFGLETTGPASPFRRAASAVVNSALSLLGRRTA